MSPDEHSEKLSRIVAEHILALIFGEDLTNCNVNVDQVATAVQSALDSRLQEENKIRTVYEEVIASIHKLSTPPQGSQMLAREDLQELLTERLDAIREVSAKMIETIEEIHAKRRTH